MPEFTVNVSANCRLFNIHVCSRQPSILVNIRKCFQSALQCDFCLRKSNTIWQLR